MCVRDSQCCATVSCWSDGWHDCTQAATVTWAELMVRQRLGSPAHAVSSLPALQAVEDYAQAQLRQTPHARGLRRNDAFAVSSAHKHLIA